MAHKNRVEVLTASAQEAAKEKMLLYVQELRKSMHYRKGQGISSFDDKTALKIIKKMSALSEKMKRQIWHDCQELGNAVQASKDNPLKAKLQMIEQKLELLEEDLS